MISIGHRTQTDAEQTQGALTPQRATLAKYPDDGVARRRSCWGAILAVAALLLALYGALYVVAGMYSQPRLQVCDARVQGGRMVYDPLTGNATLQGVRVSLHLCWK